MSTVSQVRFCPVPSLALFQVVRRNFLVWRKLIFASISGLLLDPAVALFGIGLGIGSMVGKVGDTPYIVLLASAMACYSAAMTASFESMYSAFSRMHMQKTWESILCAPMLIDDVFLGELVWAALKATISASAMQLAVVAFGFLDPATALLVMPLVFCGALTMAAMGLAYNALANSYDFFTYYFSIFLTPMIMLSGLFFPRASLPAPLYLLSEWLPLTQLIEVVRPLALGERPPELAAPLLYFLLVTALFVTVGFRLTCRRMVK